mmetsp:Transcript_25247/g.63538  ORF Transcript_25247/g.63538 Transcript_25247/m.63538 type:complete len:229 (+) Transcript_25247:2294-2980(+)
MLLPDRFKFGGRGGGGGRSIPGGPGGGGGGGCIVCSPSANPTSSCRSPQSANHGPTFRILSFASSSMSSSAPDRAPPSSELTSSRPPSPANKSGISSTGVLDGERLASLPDCLDPSRTQKSVSSRTAKCEPSVDIPGGPGGGFGCAGGGGPPRPLTSEEPSIGGGGVDAIVGGRIAGGGGFAPAFLGEIARMPPKCPPPTPVAGGVATFGCGSKLGSAGSCGIPALLK